MTWSDLAAPPPGPRRFLRLRVAAGPPPFVFTDAPALLTATATHPRIGVDLLWSDRANVETGYDLQRLPPGEIVWQAFAGLPAARYLLDVRRGPQAIGQLHVDVLA